MLIVCQHTTLGEENFWGYKDVKAKSWAEAFFKPCSWLPCTRFLQDAREIKKRLACLAIFHMVPIAALHSCSKLSLARGQMSWSSPEHTTLLDHWTTDAVRCNGGHYRSSSTGDIFLSLAVVAPLQGIKQVSAWNSAIPGLMGGLLRNYLESSVRKTPPNQ